MTAIVARDGRSIADDGKLIGRGRSERGGSRRGGGGSGRGGGSRGNRLHGLERRTIK